MNGINAAAILIVICSLSTSAYSATPSNQYDWAIEAPLATHSLLLDITNINGQLVTVGTRGHILYSKDCGKHWTQASVPTRATLTAVFFHNTQLGWAVGHDGVILRTIDNAQTWQLVYSNVEAQQPFFDIWFRDSKYGIAIGAYGAYAETLDGGDNWTKKRIDEHDLHYYSISSFPGAGLIIAGEAGGVYLSFDDGQSWRQSSTPYSGTFFSSLALNQNSLFVFGLRGHAYRSLNAGESWLPITIPLQATIEGALINQYQSIYLSGHSGLLLVSNDNGKHFAPIKTGNRQNFSAVVQCATGQLIVVGEKGIQRFHPDELKNNDNVH